jgi:hypothetical protein
MSIETTGEHTPESHSEVDAGLHADEHLEVELAGADIRATGSERSADSVSCPRCGTPLTKTVSAYGSTSLSLCPSCHPTTTAGEGDLPRTTGS